MKKSMSSSKTLLIILIVFITGFAFAQKIGNITVEANESIQHIMVKKKAYNKGLKEIKGFKIQLFNGSENGAYRVRDNFNSIFSETDVKIQYASPEWKVWAGNYKTRLEADRALIEIKEAFPTAIVIPAMIKI